MLPLDLHMAMRYLGMTSSDPGQAQAVRETAAQLMERIKPRFTYREFAVERKGDAIALPDAGLMLSGQMARTMLADCERAVLMVCTLGATFDAWLRTEQARDMAHAVILDACGSAYVESGCDAAEQEIAARHPQSFLTDRFSPGYGDLPLELQPDILAATDAVRRLGVTVSPSNLMNPSKTVTAVIGLADRPQRARIRGCAYCSMRKDCPYHERGERCHV